MANLAYNPLNSTMYLLYGFNSYRSIETDGGLSGNLGNTQAGYGMAFDESGVLYGTDLSDMFEMNSANGATIPPLNALTGGSLYTSFGGNMAWAPDTYYYANEFNSSLASIGTDGQVTTIGSFTGTGYSNTAGHAMFLHENQMYLLNGLGLYEVNLATAALTRLGTITGVGGDNASPGFSGAASFTPVPEPSTTVMAILAIGAAGLARRGRR